MVIHDLGLLPYHDAWAMQERAHEEVHAGGEERIFLVEHPPVITLGRRPGIDQNLRATPRQLAAQSVEVVQSDRGGDITFHGPGQLVAYPIIRLADHGFSVGSYVHTLESIVISTLAELGIQANADPAAVGVWTPLAGIPAKVCAIGVRIRRGISLHGLALNVTTDLNFFNLIIPCGFPNRPVTSLQQLLPDNSPSMSTIKTLLGAQLLSRLSQQPI